MTKHKPSTTTKWIRSHRFALFYGALVLAYVVARMVHYELSHAEILTYPSVELFLIHFIEGGAE
jgi:hypothetical protein